MRRSLFLLALVLFSSAAVGKKALSAEWKPGDCPLAFQSRMPGWANMLIGADYELQSFKNISPKIIVGAKWGMRSISSVGELGPIEEKTSPEVHLKPNRKMSFASDSHPGGGRFCSEILMVRFEDGEVWKIADPDFKCSIRP